MAGEALDRAMKLIARLPGLGPRSARRVALHLLKHKEAQLLPLADALKRIANEVRTCSICGNLDDLDPCGVCSDPEREPSLLCVVEQVDDLWAMERGSRFRGRYHVLGGTLSAIDGIGPEDLRIPQLAGRLARTDPPVSEVVIALGTTVDGQTTAHYVAQALAHLPLTVTRLGQGVPLGGQLTYLDDGTIDAALAARRPLDRAG